MKIYSYIWTSVVDVNNDIAWRDLVLHMDMSGLKSIILQMKRELISG